MKKRIMDSNSYASSPGSLSISKTKLKKLRPDLYGVKGYLLECREKKIKGFSQLDYIKEHIFYGDSQPAVVLSIEPLIIGAYSDELDCVVPLYFSKVFVKSYNLKEKSRLLTINTYRSGTELQKDIILGDKNLGRWCGFEPIIAEFVSEDLNIIRRKKEEISEEDWEYVYKLGVEYRERFPNICRDGRPVYSQIPESIIIKNA